MTSRFQIDPECITNYDLNHEQLELHILFWICAAGKNANTASRGLEIFLTNWSSEDVDSPFEIIRRIVFEDLPYILKQCGIGCYNAKAKSFYQLSFSNLNLKTCTVEELEQISGIGPKTARCFVIHSRPDQKYAGLDTHILSYMRDQGFVVPKATPTGRKYREIEQQFLKIAEQSGKTVAEFDLEIWRKYSGRAKNEIIQ